MRHVEHPGEPGVCSNPGLGALGTATPGEDRRGKGAFPEIWTERVLPLSQLP